MLYGPPCMKNKSFYLISFAFKTQGNPLPLSFLSESFDFNGTLYSCLPILYIFSQSINFICPLELRFKWLHTKFILEERKELIEFCFNREIRKNNLSDKGTLFHQLNIEKSTSNLIIIISLTYSGLFEMQSFIHWLNSMSSHASLTFLINQCINMRILIYERIKFRIEKIL